MFSVSESHTKETARGTTPGSSLRCLLLPIWLLSAHPVPEGFISSTMSNPRPAVRPDEQSNPHHSSDHPNRCILQPARHDAPQENINSLKDPHYPDQDQNCPQNVHHPAHFASTVQSIIRRIGRDRFLFRDFGKGKWFLVGLGTWSYPSQRFSVNRTG